MAKKDKPLPPIAWLVPRVKTTRALSLVSFIGLIALLLIWNLFFANLHGARPWVIISVELAALLIIAPGVLLGSSRTHAWAAFIANLYFMKGVLAAFDPNRVWLGVFEITLSVCLFMGALYYARWSSQLQRAQQTQTAA